MHLLTQQTYNIHLVSVLVVVIFAVARSSSRKKFWVSFREAGQRSKEIYLSKGSGGQIQGDPDGNLVVKDQSSVRFQHYLVAGLHLFICSLNSFILFHPKPLHINTQIK